MLKRKLHSSGPGQTALTMAAAVLLVAAALLIFLQSQAEAQGNDKATSNLALSSPNPGELVITWDAPSNAPDDYRLIWKPSPDEQVSAPSRKRTPRRAATATPPDPSHYSVIRPRGGHRI